MRKIFNLILILLLLIVLIYFKNNSHLFYAKYADFKSTITNHQVMIDRENIKKNMKENFYQFENTKLNYKEIYLEDAGIEFSGDIDAKPIGYIDIYKNKVFLVTYDGNFYISNSIKEIKNKKLFFKKIKVNDNPIKLHSDDDMNYRNIKIRDILIHNDFIFIVSNDSHYDSNSEEYFASLKILKGKINMEANNIIFSNFFTTEEKYLDTKNGIDWSHTGGRIIHLKNDDYIFSSSEFYLKPHEVLVEKVTSNNSIAGKTFLINEKEVKIFSKGHRNIQGIFYDKKNDLIFSSEHGPSGGDEINIIKKGKDYGWPRSSYGSLGYDGPKIPRKHKKFGYQEPLYYWWPYNCAPSEITMIDKNFVKTWEESILVSCLSGNNLNGESLIRFVYDKKKK